MFPRIWEYDVISVVVPFTVLFRKRGRIPMKQRIHDSMAVKLWGIVFVASKN